MIEETDYNPVLDYTALIAEFSSEEQNAAAWLSLVLLLAENRAMLDAMRKVMIDKGVATQDELTTAITAELTQPSLGQWYGFMNQLYGYRVAETLDIQRKRKAGELTEEETPKGDIKDVSGGTPIPTGPPAPADIEATTTILQTETSNAPQD